MVDWKGSWIWSSLNVPKRNSFVRFRRRFAYKGGAANLHITADSRYVVYVNGEYLGQGPVRCWPSHWRYDTYDLAPHLVPGDNLIAVLVNHYGEGNFQYNVQPPGLLAQLEIDGDIIVSDNTWRAMPDPAFTSITPRISLQEGFEEQFDARNDHGWTQPEYNDDGWIRAAVLRPAADNCHQNPEPRGIPFLTLEPVTPQRVVNVEAVTSLPYGFSFSTRTYLIPGDLSSHPVFGHAYLATQVYAPQDAEIRLISPHRAVRAFRVNGKDVTDGEAHLQEGWNTITASLRWIHHDTQSVFCVDGPEGLIFSSTREDSASQWAFVGPFGFSQEDTQVATAYPAGDCFTAQPVHTSATAERGEQFWAASDLSAFTREPFFQQIAQDYLPQFDVFRQAYTDRVTNAPVAIERQESLVSGSDWTVVHPTENGDDVRILLDFGKEINGFHRFEIDAAAGTIVDFHNFEFIQPDGRHNFAESMNNSFRYICRGGKQRYQSIVRRGFQYSYLILRNMTSPVKLRRVEVLFSSYPQSRRGAFACSEAQLDRIWQIGAQTLRCCAEDTYTDCPTYEQTHWVGDARNEALIDWAINGDPRLWYRCLEQTGDSLERSPITESHVPSSWSNILPAWSFLWMRSCREYLLHSGDVEKSRKLLEYVARNVQGIVQHINDQGLFDISAWNMFDWAAMDTPPDAVVTHQNCMAVHALRDVAEMADWLGESKLATDWRSLADSLSLAINRQLWNDEKAAYTDCLRGGSTMSEVYSQQTQTVAYMSGVAQGERATRCRDIIYNPPEGFVKAGSPFFEFFLLEAYQQEGREQEFLDTIRRDWGFMVDAGATTFWEMWSQWGGRLTRSHCHGWSAAPTFFLNSYVLGVSPGGVGYSPVIIEPHPGDLKWCRGTMPTPHGDIHVQWENEPDKPFTMRVLAPENLEIKINLPRDGVATLNGKEVASGKG